MDVINSDSKKKLEEIYARLDHLDERKDDLREDYKIVFEEAKGLGFDVKYIRQVQRLKKSPKAKRETDQQMIDLYGSVVDL